MCRVSSGGLISEQVCRGYGTLGRQMFVGINTKHVLLGNNSLMIQNKTLTSLETGGVVFRAFSWCTHYHRGDTCIETRTNGTYTDSKQRHRRSTDTKANHYPKGCRCRRAPPTSKPPQQRSGKVCSVCCCCFLAVVVEELNSILCTAVLLSLSVLDCFDLFSVRK